MAVVRTATIVLGLALLCDLSNAQSECSALYAQCGGLQYTGPTCCVAGAACSALNPYYSQCVPSVCQPNQCKNGGTCNPSDGTCACRPGFNGTICDSAGETTVFHEDGSYWMSYYTYSQRYMVLVQPSAAHANDYISLNLSWATHSGLGGDSLSVHAGATADAPLVRPSPFSGDSHTLINLPPSVRTCLVMLRTTSNVCSKEDPVNFRGFNLTVHLYEDMCRLSPCKNGATCYNGMNSFTCLCAPGFSGSICDLPASSPLLISSNPISEYRLSFYRDSQTYSLLIQPAPIFSDRFIRLTLNVASEPNYDSVLVYRGVSTSLPMILASTWSGNYNNVVIDFDMADRAARIDFITDNSIGTAANSAYTGFSVTVEFVLPGIRSHHAVLVAGSQGYSDYRHQSDVCHAYHVLVQNGIPPENIIVMQSDDIANAPQNPYPGKVFNTPTEPGTPGVDVYAGCPKHYTGTAVTPANFVAVLTGNSSATQGRKVLTTTSTDNIFVFFSGHGGSVGWIGFPNSQLSPEALNGALESMHSKHMYNKLVFYMESCFGGMMFTGRLNASLNVYVTTASDPDEESKACYCAPYDMVDGVSIGTCLADDYADTWIRHAQRQSNLNVSLQDQFVFVRDRVALSTPQQYGSLEFVSEAISEFEALISSAAAGLRTPRLHSAALPSAAALRVGSVSPAGVRFPRLHQLYYAYLQHTATDQHTAAAALLDELNAVQRGQPTPADAAAGEPTESGVVSSSDVALHTAYYRFIRAASHAWSDGGAAGVDSAMLGELARAVEAEVRARDTADKLLESLDELSKSAITKTAAAATDRMAQPQAAKPEAAKPRYECGECCTAVINAYTTRCGQMNEYSASRLLRRVVKLCDNNSNSVTARLTEAVDKRCAAASA